MPKMATMRQRAAVVALLLAAIWAIEAVNWALGHGLNRFGILPRSMVGLPGIVLAPVLSAAIVGGYGFLVWMYQLMAGPPGS